MKLGWMALLAALPLPLVHAQPGAEVIKNAQIEARAAQPSLAAAFRSIVQSQSLAAWVGYSIPIAPGQSQGCRGAKVFLEGPTRMVMLFRILERTVDKVRAVTVDCSVDAGGLRLYWLTDVKTAESSALLTGMLSDSRERVREQLVTALAWSGELNAVAGVIEKDPEIAVKKKAVFALTQIPKGEGVPTLIDVARNHRNAAVRKQAVVWLGKSADPRALKFFEEVLAAGR